jgi:hypothetical protein
MMDSSKRNGRTRVYGDEGPAQLTHSKSLCRGDLHTRSQSWRVVSSMVCRRCRRCRRGSRWAQGERKERSEGTGAVGPGPCYDFYYACRIGLVHGAMSSVGFSARFLGCPGAGAWKLHGRRPAGRPAKPSKAQQAPAHTAQGRQGQRTRLWGSAGCIHRLPVEEKMERPGLDTVAAEKGDSRQACFGLRRARRPGVSAKMVQEQETQQGLAAGGHLALSQREKRPHFSSMFEGRDGMARRSLLTVGLSVAFLFLFFRL